MTTLSALIERVKRGSSVLIVDRGRPVARLEPVRRTGGDADNRLDQLVRDGIVRLARGSLPRALIATAPPRAANNASGVRVLVDERRDGR